MHFTVQNPNIDGDYTDANASLWHNKSKQGEI